MSNEQHVRELALVTARAKLIELIAARAPERLDRYADLRSQARTPAAWDLISQVYWGIAEHEQTSGRRVLRRRARTGAKLDDAIQRFVGDLLRARTGTNATGRIYRPTGNSQFSDVPVTSDMFKAARDGLKALGLVGHSEGHSRYRQTGFTTLEIVGNRNGRPVYQETGPADHRYTVPGHAARFWPTPQLLKLAEDYGITSDNAEDHFFPEPPKNPLVLRDFGTGHGRNKERGRIIKDYKRTPETEKLEGDIRELNEFLATFKLTGGRHYGYQRVFNNASWEAGGRLYSVGESYQQHSEDKRLEMKINDKPVAEIDIRASHLTIYHAMVGEPLDTRSDPYARVKIDRNVAKLWVMETLGNGAPKTKWSPETVKDYKAKGQQLPKAATVAKAMLEAFPALKKLEEHPRNDLWATLQYLESEAILATMLILKRRHKVPSYSMHDGLLIPQLKWDLATDILKTEYHRVIGVEPMITVDPKPETFDARYL